jgi:hypothetical protein
VSGERSSSRISSFFFLGFFCDLVFPLTTWQHAKVPSPDYSAHLTAVGAPGQRQPGLQRAASAMAAVAAKHRRSRELIKIDVKSHTHRTQSIVEA